MEYLKIKNTISLLAQKHTAAGTELEDIKDTDLLENNALMLIADYCEEMGYQVMGFPHEKRKQADTDLDFDEDYFCIERFELYIDTLSTIHEDVADLTWHYVSSFWPDQFDSKESYLQLTKEQIDCGIFYDVEF